MNADRHFDPGCQLERTALASNRLLLTLCVNGALLVRTAGTVGWWTALVGLLVLLSGGILWLSTSRAYRRLRGTPADRLLGEAPTAAALTGLVAAVGLADLVVVAVHP